METAPVATVVSALLIPAAGWAVTWLALIYAQVRFHKVEARRYPDRPWRGLWWDPPRDPDPVVDRYGRRARRMLIVMLGYSLALPLLVGATYVLLIVVG
jgi:hypothetical protein